MNLRSWELVSGIKNLVEHCNAAAADTFPQSTVQKFRIRHLIEFTSKFLRHPYQKKLG